MGQSIMGSSMVGPNGQKINILKNAHQNVQQQLEEHRGFIEAKKAREEKEKKAKQDKLDKKNKQQPQNLMS